MDENTELHQGVPTAMVLAYMSEVLGGILAIADNLNTNITLLKNELEEDNSLDALASETADDSDDVSDNG